MSRIETSRTISAPREEVFEVAAHIEDYAEVIPQIVGVEFLTDQRTGTGTRFRETRRIGRRRASSELEVTEYERPARVRLVSDQGGVLWDTTYTFLTSRDGTDLHLSMDVKPHAWYGRFTAWMAKGPTTRALNADLDAVQAHFDHDELD